MQKQQLAELIARYLEPIKGRKTQIEFSRSMTKALQLSPDSISGMPTISRVREVVKKTLSMFLIEAVTIKIGDYVTYHSKYIDHLRPGPAGFNDGEDGTVVKVHKDRLGVQFKDRTNSQVVPLYVPELLAQIDLQIDFMEMDRRARAMR